MYIHQYISVPKYFVLVANHEKNSKLRPQPNHSPFLLGRICIRHNPIKIGYESETYRSKTGLLLLLFQRVGLTNPVQFCHLYLQPTGEKEKGKNSKETSFSQRRESEVTHPFHFQVLERL